MSTRNGTIDLARYFAALGIVLLHAKSPYGWIGDATLLLFVMLLASFAVPREPSTAALRRRLGELMRLWVVWSAVYAGLKMAQAIGTGATIASEFAPWMLLAGPSLHLWFLPFAAGITLAGYAIALWLQRMGAAAPGRRAAASRAVVLLMLAGTVAAVAALEPAAETVPLVQWANAWPAAALGLAIAVLRKRLAPEITALAALVALAAAGWLLPPGAQASAAANLAPAVAMFALTSAARTPSSRLTMHLRDVALNVYLLHPAVIAALLQFDLATIATARLFWLASALSTGLALALLALQHWRSARRGPG